MAEIKELHSRLESLSTEIELANTKIELQDALHGEHVNLRELKARHSLLTEQLKRDVKDPTGLGDLETAFRRWINRLDFDK